jgi:hypothetical protein
MRGIVHRSGFRRFLLCGRNSIPITTSLFEVRMIRQLTGSDSNAYYSLRLTGLERHPEAFGTGAEDFKKATDDQVKANPNEVIMCKFISSLCLIAGLALASSAHASVSCEDQIREAVLQGQSCNVENIEINSPELTTISTGSAQVTCGSDTTTIDFAVSAEPSCNVAIFPSNPAVTAHTNVMQPDYYNGQPGRCGIMPYGPCAPACNPRVRPCDAPPVMVN